LEQVGAAAAAAAGMYIRYFMTCGWGVMVQLKSIELIRCGREDEVSSASGAVGEADEVGA
jgi:hypothetical protein